MDSPWPKEQGLRRGDMSVVFAKRKVGRSVLMDRVRRGDLVEWSPEGPRGLWEVIEVSVFQDAGDLTPDEARAALADQMAQEMTQEIDDDILRTLGVPVKRVDLPASRATIRHFGGWCGDEVEVEVAIKDIRVLNGLEVLALAGLDG